MPGTRKAALRGLVVGATMAVLLAGIAPPAGALAGGQAGPAVGGATRARAGLGVSAGRATGMTKPPLDRTFGGGDGILAVALTRWPRHPDEAIDAVLPGPGSTFRTVTSGYSADNAIDSGGFVTVRRFTARGRVDPAFNGGRPRVLSILYYGQGGSRSLAATGTDAAGRTYVLALLYDGPETADLYGYRVTAAGVEDTDYAFTVPTAPATLPGADEGDYPLGTEGSMAVLPDGRVRVCIGRYGQEARRYLVGYTADGQVDSAFGTGEAPGWAVVPTAVESCGRMAADSAGRILMTDRGSVWRLTPAGAVDLAFGVGGRAQLTTPGLGLDAWRIAVAADGSAYVGGAAGRPDGSEDDAVPFVARLTAAGALDAAFGTGGVRVLDLPHRLLSGLTLAGAGVATGPGTATGPGRALGSGSATGSVYVSLSVDVKWVTTTVRNAVLRLSSATGATDTAWGTAVLPSHHQGELGPVCVVLAADGRRVLVPYTASRTPTRNAPYVQARLA